MSDFTELKKYVEQVKVHREVLAARVRANVNTDPSNSWLIKKLLVDAGMQIRINSQKGQYRIPIAKVKLGYVDDSGLIFNELCIEYIRKKTNPFHLTDIVVGEYIWLIIDM